MATHFSNEALKFLRGLKRNNDREWFAERKAVYEREVKAPMLALVGEVNEAMLGFAPENVRPPQKAMMRIYRDIRFSADKRPYKTHQGAWWARTGLEKTSGGGFYFHVSGAGVPIGAGGFVPEREPLLALRRYLVGPHAAMRALPAGDRTEAPLHGGPGLRAERQAPPV